MKCHKCEKEIKKEEKKEHELKPVCEDCLVEILFNKNKKVIAYNEDDSSFIRRLKPPFDNRRLNSK